MYIYIYIHTYIHTYIPLQPWPKTWRQWNQSDPQISQPSAWKSANQVTWVSVSSWLQFLRFITFTLKLCPPQMSNIRFAALYYMIYNIYVCTYIWVYTGIYICKCMYVCLYVCMYACMLCVCVCVYIYIYSRVWTRWDAL